MNTLGWLLILAGALAIRQLAVGRANNLPTDARDFFTAALHGDSASLSEVAARRGTSVAPATDPAASVSGGGGGVPNASGKGSALIAAMKARGSKARGYRWGATGPDFYDCSGLTWRGCQDAGIYNGVRFTTSTFPLVALRFASKVTTPAPGDIVLWYMEHMGVVTGSDLFYSARSVETGIGEGKISSHPSNRTPEYWRING